MGPKRKAAEVVVEEEEEEEEEVVNPATQKKKKAKKPTTLKEKILDLLSKQEKFIGLVTLKKILKDDYDVEDSKANNNRINKTLKDLENENRDDFGKVGGSYHGGVNSAPYQEYAAEEAEKEARQKEWKDHKDELKCPHCSNWNDEMKADIGEDSIARGSKFKCLKCKKIFFTWISDHYWNRVGHKVEYKFGKDYF